MRFYVKPTNWRAHRTCAPTLLGIVALLTSGVSGAAEVYITNFPKTNNIYTTLNEQFPNTGPGTPGSGKGVPNATFLFNPATYTSQNAVAGSNLANNGINFELTSNSNGQDFWDQPGGLTIPANVQNATAVHLLVASYDVVAGTHANLIVSFTAGDGTTEPFYGIPVNDFNDVGNVTINQSYTMNGSPTVNVLDQTVFIARDVGGGGTGNSVTGGNNDYALTELTFFLNSTFATKGLKSIYFQGTAYTPILLGVTVEGLPKPSTLDFTGDGRSGALLYIPGSGQSYSALSNGNGIYQYVPNLFTPGFDVLRTGDYNGDGKADTILYNSQTALAYIGFGNGDGTFDFQSLFWSPGYDTVETGDINGDGKTDVALYNRSTGTLYTGISNGSGGFVYQYHLVSMDFTFVRLADFTGDGKADLLLYNSNNGLAFLGVGDGTGNFIFDPLSISPGYDIADTGDLNGDGKADLILYDSANGNAATGIGNGSGGFTFTPLIFSPNFTSVRLADYTGDGKADVTVYNKLTGAAYFGTGTGTGNFTFQSLFWSPGYDFVIPEDVDGDGKFDVVLYGSTTGTEYTGVSNGNGAFSYTYQYWGTGRALAR